MTTFVTSDLGRLFLPELSAVQFLPGSTVPRRRSPVAVVTASVRSAGTRTLTQATYGIGGFPNDGRANQWCNSDDLQRRYPTLDEYLASFTHTLKQLAITHNGRTINGGNMVSKRFWGSTASVVHPVNAPIYIAVGQNSWSYTGTNLSIGSDLIDTSSNEWTSNGLSRMAGTISGVTSPATGSDSQFSLNVFTSPNFVAGASGLVATGAGLFDNTLGSSNMYAEATFTSATLSSGDNLLVTWQIAD